MKNSINLSRNQRIKNEGLDSYSEQIKSAKTLYLCSNKLTRLSISMNNLTILHVKNNHLKELPFLPLLENLNCDNNKELISIPYYPKLKELTISRTSITNLDTRYNYQLTYLNCSQTTLDLTNYKWKKLEYLYCSEIGINKIYSHQFPSLNYLDISNNPIDRIETFEYLKELNADECSLCEIETQPQMINLNISHNKIKFLPSLPKIEILEASYNRLMNVPKYQGLTKLNVSSNQLTEINSYPLLEHLECSQNKIKVIASNNKLEFLSTYDNLLTRLPILPELIDLFIWGNDIELNLSNYPKLDRLELFYFSYQNLHESIDDRIKYITTDLYWDGFVRNMELSDDVRSYMEQYFKEKVKMDNANVKIREFVEKINSNKDTSETLYNNLLNRYFSNMIVQIAF
jgi:hypothetical protein